MNKMLIAKKKSVTDVILEETCIPEIKENQVLLKVVSCGVCGGDINSSENYKEFGHEIAGIVEKIGKHVTNIAVGDRIVTESNGFCGYCNACRNGKVDLCENTLNTKSAGFAEYAAVPEKNCVKLPDDISFKQAGMIEPLGVALDIIKVSEITLGDHILIYGAGSIGLMALQLAKKCGATKIFVVLRSHSKKKAELALKFGADHIIYSDKVNLCDYKFPKGGVDKAIITAPNKVIPETLSVLNYGGTATFIGFGGDNMITIDALHFHVRKLQLKSSFSKPGIYFPLAIETIQSNVIDTQSIITHTLPLSKIKELMYIAGVERDKVVKAVMLNE